MRLLRETGHGPCQGNGGPCGADTKACGAERYSLHEGCRAKLKMFVFPLAYWALASSRLRAAALYQLQKLRFLVLYVPDLLAHLGVSHAQKNAGRVYALLEVFKTTIHFGEIGLVHYGAFRRSLIRDR